MGLLEAITLAVALGTDAFSIAIVCGVQQFNSKKIFQISTVIACFHTLMTLLGIYGGHSFEYFLVESVGLNSNIDGVLRLVGAGLLALIGFYMIIERWFDRASEFCIFNFTGWGTLTLAFSVSIDSLSAGVSLGILGDITLPIVLLIGSTAGVMMAAGLFFGYKVGSFLGEGAQQLGGIALIFLAVHFAGYL